MMVAVPRVRLVTCLALLVAACSPPMPEKHAAVKRPAGVVMADDITIAHTPQGGYGKAFPAPVLKSCTEPLVKGAPDLRGIWKAWKVERGGKPAPKSDRLWNYVERIEQCGNRIVDMGGGTIADARADGTLANGVHDVSVFDFKTPIHVAASYEDGVFVLRPLLVNWIPLTVPFIEVTRKLDRDGHMVWVRPDLGGLRMVLERVGGPNDPWTRQ